MSNYIKEKLGDICTVINGRAYKQNELLDDGKYKVLRVGNFFTNNSWYYSDLELPDNKYCEDGDLLFAWSASFGPKIWKGGKCIYHYHIWKMVEDESKIDKYYLYYYLLNVSKSLLSSTHGSIMQHLTKSFIEDLEIKFPKDLSEQRRIANVLSVIDKKISTNEKINSELFNIAKLIYTYWFEQFEFPNNYGKPYKSSGGETRYSKKLGREIPKEWKLGNASELLEINPTSSLSRGKEYSYIDMNAIPETGFMTDVVKKKQYKGGMKFKNGDVVVARITPCLENGKTALITLLDENEVAFGSTEFIVLRGKEMKLSAYTACLSRSKRMREYAITRMTGTSGRKRVNKNAFKTYKMPIPEKNILKNFEDKVSSFFEISTVNTRQNFRLKKLRDWLLPMLINGQVTVKEAEKELTIAAEPETKYKATKKPTNIDFYRRTVLAAEIVWQLHRQPTLGHVKLQKIIYLAQQTSNMSLPTNFVKQAAGPYDPQMARSLDKQFKQKKWFEFQKDEFPKYKLLENAGEHKADFNRYFHEEKENIQFFIDTFKKAKTDKVEIIATLYACWKEIIDEGKAVTNDLLIEQFYNWSEEKARFKQERLEKAINWMRDEGVYPVS